MEGSNRFLELLSLCIENFPLHLQDNNLGHSYRFHQIIKMMPPAYLSDGDNKTHRLDNMLTSLLYLTQIFGSRISRGYDTPGG